MMKIMQKNFYFENTVLRVIEEINYELLFNNERVNRNYTKST